MLENGSYPRRVKRRNNFLTVLNDGSTVQLTPKMQ